MDFRRINEKDVDELYSLLNELTSKAKSFFHPHQFDKKTLSEICSRDNKDYYFVLIFDRKIIGYSMLRLFGTTIPSFGCCVRSGFEGRGYGSALTAWTINKSKELGYDKIILKIHKENIFAFQMYKRAGFIVTSTNGDEIKMERIEK